MAAHVTHNGSLSTPGHPGGGSLSDFVRSVRLKCSQSVGKAAAAASFACLPTPPFSPLSLFYMGVCPRGCASSGIGMWRQQRRRRRGIRGRVRRNQEELGHRFFGPAPQLNRPPPWSFFRLPPPPAPPPFPFALAKSFVSCVTVSVRSSRSFSNDADLALQYIPVPTARGRCDHGASYHRTRHT